jgi:hypothetical protein
VAHSSGNDVILDALLLRRHTEPARRRAGAIGLRLMDLDHHRRGLLRLSEKAARCAGSRPRRRITVIGLLARLPPFSPLLAASDRGDLERPAISFAGSRT